MRIGVALHARYEVHHDVAQAAEELGYESVWLPEHLIWPAVVEGSPYAGGGPAADPEVPTLDTLLWLVSLAGATHRLRLGTYVYNLALRSPFVAARAVQTLDLVSGGRIELGVGAGWSRGEYDAVGVDFATRGRRLDECLAIVRALWTQARPSYDGEFFSFGAVVFEPKPVQRPVPVSVGGESPAALRRAVRLGDGWVGLAHTPSTAAAAVEELRRLCVESGRDPANLTTTVGGSCSTPADVVAYAGAGIDRLLVSPWRRSADAVDGLRRWAPLLQEAGT